MGYNKHDLDSQDSSSSSGVPAKRPKTSDTETHGQHHGLTKFLHGITYQQKLLILLPCHAAKEMKADDDFSMTTEDPTAGKFDDIVFCVGYGDPSDRLCIQAKHKDPIQAKQKDPIQAKHKDNRNPTITLKDFESPSGPFSLSEYFNSFLHQHLDHSTTTKLVLCTNARLDPEVTKIMEVFDSSSFNAKIFGSFFDLLNCKLYRFNIEQIDVRQMFQLLDDGSDFKKLAQQLAGCIYNNQSVIFTNSLFKTYRDFIQNKIASQKKLNENTYEVNKTFSDAEKFRKEFETEYQKLLPESGKDVWSDIESKGIKLTKENKTESSKLPIKMEMSHMDLFFPSFLVASNTANDEQLNDIIENLLKNNDKPQLSSDILNTNLAEFGYDRLSKSILDWMKDKTRKPLKKQFIEDILGYLAVSLKFLQFDGMSISYCDKFEGLRFQFNQEVLKKSTLYQQLSSWQFEGPDNRNDDNMIVQYNYPSYVVHGFLQFFKDNLNYLFIEDKNFQNHHGTIMNIFFKIKFSLILVIDCQSKSKDIMKKIKEWTDAHQYQTSHLSKHTFIKKIAILDKNFSGTETESNLRFGDLSDECRREIMKPILEAKFFGTEISPKELILEEDNLDFVFYIVKLPKKARIKCNILTKSFEKIKDMFIERSLQPYDKTKEQINETSSWPFNERSRNVSSLFSDGEGKAEIKFDVVLNQTSFNSAELSRSFQNRNPVIKDLPGYKSKTQDQLESDLSNCNKRNLDIEVHVIFNEAGSGKSDYLTWLAIHLQDLPTSWWIVKFNLNEYSQAFKKLLKIDKRQPINKLITVRFFFQLVFLAFHVDNRFQDNSSEKLIYAQSIANSLYISEGCLKLHTNKVNTVSSEDLILLRVFIHKFNRREIVILMDGFDEIAPMYTEVVLKLLTNLKKLHAFCKLYLSSRPYGLRNQIETTLKDCNSFRLKEFNNDDQCLFIHRYLSKHSDDYKLLAVKNQARTSYVVFNILQMTLRNMMENPLFLSLGMRVFKPLMVKHMKLNKETISRGILKGCDNSFELLSMIRHFVKEKLKILNSDKTGLTEASQATQTAVVNAKELGKHWNRMHSLLALFTVFERKDTAEILSEKQKKEAYEFMEKVNKASQKFGLIEVVANGRPIFQHRLFAEYFSAFWLYANKRKRKVKSFLKYKIYEIGWPNRYNMVKVFLDRMICKKKEGLHMAIIDGYNWKIDRILTDCPESINVTDEWGRTPLQLAMLQHNGIRQFDIVRVLCNLDQKSFNLKDQYFEWFTIDYAYICDKRYTILNTWHWVRASLNKGASIDTHEMLIRFSTKYRFWVEVLMIEYYTERVCKSDFESFFSKLVENVGQKKGLDVIIPVGDDEIENERVKFVPSELFYETIKHIRETMGYRSKIPILEFCIMIDSAMFKILMGNLSDTEPKQRHLLLAFKFRSINVLKYLIIDRSFALPTKNLNFEQELLVLLVYMLSDEEKFKSRFHNYCTRYEIPWAEETPINKINHWNKGILSQRSLKEYFPTKFEKRQDTGVDTGTEFLVSRALEIGNAAAVEYVLHKTNTPLNYRFIMQMLENCKTMRCCQNSFQILLDNSTDRQWTYVKGRNLLQFAAGYGNLSLVKCLVDHDDGKPTNIKVKENNFNVFFYCAFYENEKDNKKNIFAFIMNEALMDCFDVLDTKGKSVFYHASKNNREFFYHLLHIKFEEKWKCCNSQQVDQLIKLLQSSGFDAKDMLEYLEKTHLKDATNCQSIYNALKSNNELNYHDEMGRNLLHIAIMNGWFVLAKCLVKNGNFDVKKINKTENNWNAFFYSVINKRFLNDTKEFFMHMMEKDAVDCFDELDSNGKSIFSYAAKNNYSLSEDILFRKFKKRFCKLSSCQISGLIKHLKTSGFNAEDVLEYVEEHGRYIMNPMVRKTILGTINLTYRDEMGRDLLHIAITKDWVLLAKHLVQEFNFDVQKVNKQENNWNAFFYCAIKKNCWWNTELKKFFLYMMTKTKVDCFNERDSMKKSIFYYLTENIVEDEDTVFKDNLAVLIFDCKWKSLKSIEERMDNLHKSGVNAYHKIRYLTHLELSNQDSFDQDSVKTILDHMKKTGDLNYTEEKTGRNLLHIACIKGWLTIAKGLIAYDENYFYANEKNEKENNWNALFYCVCLTSEKSKKKSLEIFTLLIENNSFDCFGQLDALGMSVFCYAMFNNDKIGMEIFKRECQLQEHLPIEERIRALLDKFENSKLNRYHKIFIFEHFHLVTEESVKIICKYLETTGELYYRGEEKGRNLLHIACMEGWSTLAKYLIKSCGFELKKTNAKENNLNAFFYCVGNSTNAANKMEIFTCLMDKDPFDCFSQLDSKGRSVFWYATGKIDEIGKNIFKRECKLQEHLPIEERIPLLMPKLQISSLNAIGKLEYLEDNILVDEKSVTIICDYLKTNGELDYTHEKSGRNLLHIACMKGWSTLAKCLIEQYGFDAKEINEKDENRNAFFYCVCNSTNAANRMEIFTYLMDKNPFDCFSQQDLKGKSVLLYATDNNKEIGKDIFKRECKLQEHLPIEERIPVLMVNLQSSNLNHKGMLVYLEDNNLVDEKSVKIICDYLNKTGELDYKTLKTGRNLLHIACMEGWLTLVKCLIEDYGFDAKKNNEKDENRNAFFYCVGNSENAANKAEIFTYLMDKDPFDCSGQLDSKRRSVSWYASLNNSTIHMEISDRERKLQE